MAISSSSGAPIISASYHLLAPLGLPNFPATASDFYAKVTAPNAITPAETPSIPVLIDTQDFSRRTKLSLKTVRSLARSGRIPSIRVGRRFFFPASALIPKDVATTPAMTAGVDTTNHFSGDKHG